MASFLNRLFGGGSEKDGDQSGGAKRGERVEYQGLYIAPAPEKAGGQWRLAGVIVKQEESGERERTFLRSDTFSSKEDAESFAISKGKQIIDEQGSALFADDAQTRRV